MTSRRFYAPGETFSPDGRVVTLNPDETRHLRDVLRLRAGDEIRLFDGAGKEFQGRIEAIGRHSAKVSLIAQVEPASAESALDLTLAVGLLKGEKFDLIIQKATELGVTRIIPMLTSRADVRLRDNDDGTRKRNRWQRIALEATKQSGRACLMKVAPPIAFADLVMVAEARVASGDAWAPVRLMFAERAGTAFSQLISDSLNPKQVTALIGPEGGWTDEEIDQARAAGWKIITLAGRTLRAETAAVAIATLLQHRFGDLH